MSFEKTLEVDDGFIEISQGYPSSITHMIVDSGGDSVELRLTEDDLNTLIELLYERKKEGALMSRYYGFIQGGRGEATRAGSAASGYEAWAQNMVSRVRVRFWTNSVTDRDLVDLDLCASTQSYGGTTVRLLANVDIDALLEGAQHDAATMRHLNAAKQALEKADSAARKHRDKKIKLAAKARRAA